jgi:hypothetical protein
MAGLRAGIRNRALPTVKQGGARRKKSHVHILCTVIRKFHVNVTTAEGWSGICPVQVRSSCKEYSLTSERLNHVRPQGLICDVRCHPRWPRCTSQHTHTHTNSDYGKEVAYINEMMIFPAPKPCTCLWFVQLFLVFSVPSSGLYLQSVCTCFVANSVGNLQSH